MKPFIFIMRIMKKAGLLAKINFSLSYKLSGSGERIKLPIIDGFGVENFGEEGLWLEQLMRYCLAAKKGFFVDVGVNIGQTLIKYIKINYNDGYVGFDPNPDAIVFAERIIELNQVESAYLVPCALAKNCGAGKLWIKTNYGSAATIVENFRGSSFHDRVKGIAIINGDKALADLGIEKIAMIKIDVEGSELSVLNGFYDIISSERPFVVVEILPVYDPKQNAVRKEKSDGVVKFMKEMNYQMYRVLESSNLRLVRINKIEIHSDLSLCNYFCVPKEREDTMKDICSGSGSENL